MSVFIVGGDNLGNIENNLKQIGFNKVIHEKGRRKCKRKNLLIPKESDLIIVFTDYVAHSIHGIIKQKAKRYDIPIIYTNRSWAKISQKIMATAN
ncbi:MAG: DUF2325 domain-containing protein [Firmicutes bacterium]|nr:DUF2325 domain-containing protein [Bacillota bacterium]